MLHFWVGGKYGAGCWTSGRKARQQSCQIQEFFTELNALSRYKRMSMEIQICAQKTLHVSQFPVLFSRKNLVDLSKGPLQRTSSKWGGGGFEISDIPGGGGGWFVKVWTSENFWKKSKFQNFSELFEVKSRNIIDRDSNMRAFTYHTWRLQQPRRQQISLIKILLFHFYFLNVLVFSILNLIKTGFGQ